MCSFKKILGGPLCVWHAGGHALQLTVRGSQDRQLQREGEGSHGRLPWKAPKLMLVDKEKENFPKRLMLTKIWRAGRISETRSFLQINKTKKDGF